MKSFAVRTLTLALAMTSGLSMPGWAKPACPLDTLNATKSHTLFLYFPTVDDPTFTNYDPTAGVSPAKAFDAADLDPNIGTTKALRNRIFDVVADDYCEFNVQVQQSTTNPETLPSPPARRNTVAIGSDVDLIGGGWGLAQNVDLKDQINVDFARVWGGTYTQCEGGNGMGGCTVTGSLAGANSTLDRWAEAIGGTAAHEGGHNYGLSHTDDNPVNSTCISGQGERPGEDIYEHHLMPSGCNLTGEARAGYRRHFSDRTFGLLATSVGLTVETMHNWDLINPNAQSATSLTIEFLSSKNAVATDWTFGGSESPWINPTVSGVLGTATWQGKQYNRFKITWSQPNPVWSGAPGVLPGGAPFHIGATFTGVDFNQPDPRSVFRFQNYFVTATRRWNGAGLVFDKYIGVGTNLDFKNFWYVYLNYFYNFDRLDDLDTRGGPPIVRPKSDNINFGVGTDSRKRWGVFSNVSFGHDNRGGWNGFFGPSLRLQPSSRLQTSIGANYNWGVDSAQWIENTDADGDGVEDNVYGRLRRNVVNITGRATYAFSRDMTLEAFLQPFVAVGNYSSIGKLARPGSFEFAPVGLEEDPDFNRKSLRSTVVLRWEYVRGSTLFFVWNLATSDESRPGIFSPRRDLGSAFGAPGTNVFAIKMNYWFTP